MISNYSLKIVIKL